MTSLRTLSNRFGKGTKDREMLESIYLCINNSATSASICDFDDQHIRKAIAKRIIRNWLNNARRSSANTIAQAIEDLIGTKRGHVHRLIKQLQGTR